MDLPEIEESEIEEKKDLFKTTNMAIFVILLLVFAVMYFFNKEKTENMLVLPQISALQRAQQEDIQEKKREIAEYQNNYYIYEDGIIMNRNEKQAYIEQKDNEIKKLQEQQHDLHGLAKEARAIVDHHCAINSSLVGCLSDEDITEVGGERPQGVQKEQEPKTLQEPSVKKGAGNFVNPKGPGIDLFLRANGAKDVKEAGDVFIAVGDHYNIKPEVLVCISQADSSLGKHLATKNNIGNVGNTDGGQRVGYATLETGIEAIAQKALNGTYLKNHTKIGELSGGGRKILGLKGCGKCYATSMHNWHKNVILCLRAITGDKSINENFAFRT